jgi:hypothetical protein
MSEPENANARRQPGERSNELTDESRLEVGARDVNATYGPPELCAWQVEKLGSSKGIFWLQTTVKAFGRKLSKRRDTRHVDVVGWNHFRRTYEMRGSWRKIKRLIDRYILSAAGSISPVNRLQGASQVARRVNSADLPIPLGLVTPDQVSTTTKLSAEAPQVVRKTAARVVDAVRRREPFAKSQDRVRS